MTDNESFILACDPGASAYHHFNFPGGAWWYFLVRVRELLKAEENIEWAEGVGFQVEKSDPHELSNPMCWPAMKRKENVESWIQEVWD